MNDQFDSPSFEEEQLEYKADLIDLLENRLHGIASEERNYAIEILTEVFLRVPKGDSETLIDRRNVQFIIPLNSTAAPFFINPMLVDNRPEFGGMIPLWIISLRPDLIKQPRDEFTYTIAHELAHAFLEHVGHYPEGTSMADTELDVNP